MLIVASTTKRTDNVRRCDNALQLGALLLELLNLAPASGGGVIEVFFFVYEELLSVNAKGETNTRGRGM